MSEFFDESEVEEIKAPQQQAAASTGEFFDSSTVQEIEEVQQSTGEPIPQYADGKAANRPINKSPIDIVDRFRYALGNTKGVEADLQSKFNKVLKDPKGNFVIQNSDGKWYRADPKGLGDGDAWERTRELIGDAADVLPSAAKAALTGYAATRNKFGAIFGAAAAVGGDAYSEEIASAVQNNPKKAMAAATALGLVGANGVINGAPGSIKSGLPAVAAGGAGELVRTSLGRIVGTYDATPMEQVKDIGVEMMLNLGGVAIAAGVKPTASMLAEAAKNLKNAPQASKEMAAVVIGGATGNEPGKVLTTFENGGKVAAAFNKFKAASLGAKEFTENATKDSVKWVKSIAEKAQPTLNKLWNKNQTKLLEAVPEDFEANHQPIIANIYSDMHESGLGGFFRFDSSGKKIPVDPTEVGEHFTKSNKWPDWLKFELKSRQAIVDTQKKTGFINEIANDPDAYELVQKFLGSVRGFQGMAPGKGRDGAKQLLEFGKIVDDQTYKMTTLGKEQSIPGIAKAMSGYHAKVRGSLATKFDVLDKTGKQAANPFLAMNAEYSEAKDALLPVLRASKSADKVGDSAYEALFKQITNSRNVMKKEGLGKLVKMSGDSELEQAFDNIAVNEAAKGWAPWFSSPKVTAALSGGAGIALGTGNPVPAVAAGVAAAATSPRVAFGTIRAAQTGAQAISDGIPQAIKRPVASVTQTTAAAGFKALEFLKQRTPEQIKIMTQDPRVLQMFLGTLGTAGQTHKGLSESLINQSLQETEPVQ
jgi:hypothetical protein